MTAVRPEHEGVHGDPHGASFGGDPPPYPRPEAFQAAVDALDDPLNDPLPGAPSQPEAEWEPETGRNRDRDESEREAYGRHRDGRSPDESVSPWFRPHRAAEQQQERGGPGQSSPAYGTASGYGNGIGLQETYRAPSPAEAGRTYPTTAGPALPDPGLPAAGFPEPGFPDPGFPDPGFTGPDPGEPGSAGSLFTDRPFLGGGADGPAPDGPQSARARHRAGDTETAALRQVAADSAGAPAASPAPLTVDTGAPFEDDDRRTVGLRRPDTAELGGRAARRKAAQARGRRGRGSAAQEPPQRPTSRLEARRAARAASREGLAVLASRLTGEVFISVGVLMLLFVAYQLWWTNVLAGQEAGGAANDLQQQWGSGGKGAEQKKVDPERRAGNFTAGEGFAIMHIPKLDIETPIAQGVSKKDVLDKGLVGHYDQAPLKTGMPWDEKGNFALAGHRNTHGEPFRYINRLVGGDEMVVETADKYYTYRMANRLASTSPSNTSVIQPVPPQSGFGGNGRYITLTTCTPEFTSKYRLIVWGKMVEERPRSKGKPDALVK